MDSDDDSVAWKGPTRLFVSKLEKTSDWNAWFFDVKDAAQGLLIWDVINPDIDHFPDKLVPPGEPPVLPTLPPGEHHSAQAIASHDAVVSDHNRKVLRWKERQKALNKLKTAIKTSVGHQYQAIFRDPENPTVWHWLRALSAALKPKQHARRSAAEAAFLRCNYPSKRTSVDSWLKQWYTAYHEAKQLDCPATHGTQPQYNFLNAVRLWNETWAMGELGAFERDEDNGHPTPSVDSLIGRFRSHIEANRQRAEIGRNLAASLTPTRKAEDANIAFSVAPGERTDGVNVTGKNPSKRTPPPCICGDVHWYYECAYLNGDVAPIDWQPDESVKAIVDEKLEDERLRNAVEKAIQRQRDFQARKNDNPNGQPHSRQRRFRSRTGNGQNNTNNKGRKTRLVFAASSAYSASFIDSLKASWILDSGADIHITNDRGSLRDITTTVDDQVVAGTTTYPILARGTATFQVQTPTGSETLTLSDVVFIPGFMTNVVSLSRLIEHGVHWSTEQSVLTRNGQPIVYIKRVRGHWVVSQRASKLGVDDLQNDDLETMKTLFSSSLTTRDCPDCGTMTPKVAFPVDRENSIDLNLSILWHSRLGHPGLRVMRHLPRSVEGVPNFTPNESICESCKLSKATEVVSRSDYREIREAHPFHRVSCDIIPLQPGYNEDQYIVHFHCYRTGFNLVFTEPQRRGLVRIFRLFIAHVLTQYGREVRIIRMDGESAVGEEVMDYLDGKGVRLEVSAPNTQAQNGHAERHGRTLITKARTLRVESGLPHNLWPELVKTAAYLMNRTPSKKLNWQTPFEALTGQRPTLRHVRVIGCKCYYLNHNIPKLLKLDPRASVGYLVGYQSTNIWRIWQPQRNKVIRHRDVFFDEATKFSPEDADRLPNLSSYEVGPLFDEIGPFGDVDIEHSEPPGIDVNTPVADLDGTFDTIEVLPTYSGRLAADRALLSIDRSTPTTSSTPPLSSTTVTTPSTPATERSETLSPSLPAGGVETPNKPTSQEPQQPQVEPPQVEPPQVEPPQVEPRSEPPQPQPDRQLANQAPRANEISAQTNINDILPEGSKRQRKRARRLAQFVAVERPQNPLSVYYLTFSTLLSSLSSSFYHQQRDGAPDDGGGEQRKEGLIVGGRRLHRDSIQREPTNWTELRRHPFYKYFLEAAHQEMRALFKRGTFREIDRQKHHTPLPLMWVFKYKFNTDGFLEKFKARICVRGDLQDSDRETFYAATLAVRTFRALMAFTAVNDLEMLQLDAVNAFLNSDIDEDLTVQWPTGFEPPPTPNGQRKVLKLLKGLYGLKQAPLLWYNHLVNLLLKLGLKKVPGVNCLLVSDWLTLFFYVDDIILLFTKENRLKVEAFVTELQANLELRQITDANWFLGIRIVRDRSRGLLWLCQDSYIEKIANRFNIGDKMNVLAHTPLVIERLEAYQGTATAAERQGYQSRVGSINFAAVITRPDVAKASSVLSQHLTNPGPNHLKAADRVLAYLWKTMFLAIQYGGGSSQSDRAIYGVQSPTCFMETFSDAAFADNVDRRSSSAYLMLLANGPIDWKASKQSTVTTSTTEAELLGLSNAAKELLAWQRFYRHLPYNVVGSSLIYSDNRQTIRLLNEEEPLLTTKLRHVDIHQHWLREKVQEGDIDVEWTATTTMKADGLTKPLGRQPFETFIRQLNLVDIQDAIK